MNVYQKFLKSTGRLKVVKKQPQKVEEKLATIDAGIEEPDAEMETLNFDYDE